MSETNKTPIGRTRPPSGRETVATTWRTTRDLLDRLDVEADRRVLGRSKLIELLVLKALDGIPGESHQRPLMLCLTYELDGESVCYMPLGHVGPHDWDPAFTMHNGSPEAHDGE